MVVVVVVVVAVVAINVAVRGGNLKDKEAGGGLGVFFFWRYSTVY